MTYQLTKRVATALLAVASAVFATSAAAQVDAEPLPGDPRLVVFSFDPNNSFRIHTRPQVTTHIQLDRGESVSLLAVGDSVGWITAHKDNNVFIKPRFPDTNTSGTLITNKRTYQFVLLANKVDGRWYQRVSFQDPSDQMLASQESDRAKLAALGVQVSAPNDEAIAPVARIQTPALQVQMPGPSPRSGGASPESLNFNFDIEGTGPIRPTQVWDDGQSTFIQMAGGEDMPAVFRLRENEIELVEYTVRGNTLVIPRVLEAGMLKLGTREARFYNRTKVSKRFFGGNDWSGVRQ